MPRPEQVFLQWEVWEVWPGYETRAAAFRIKVEAELFQRKMIKALPQRVEVDIRQAEKERKSRSRSSRNS